MRRQFANRLFSCVLVSICCGPVTAEDNVQVIDLFDAMEAGQIAVKFIPANAAKANVLIENVADHVLHIELPDAIAAVPVLAQFGQDPGQRGGQNGGGAGSQGVGGGLNGGGLNGGGLNGGGLNGGGQQQGLGNGGGNNKRRGGGQGEGFGMGFMRIAPEQVRKLTATTVCLEHGKPDPNPRIAYQMIPIEKLTDNTQVVKLCQQLGRHEIAQRTAQAAAWHLANGLSWEKLASINRLESKYLGNIKFFKPAELKRAKEFVKTLSIDTKIDDYASTR